MDVGELYAHRLYTGLTLY